MCDGEENYTGNICAGIYDSIELKKMWKTIRGDDLLWKKLNNNLGFKI